MNDENEIIYIGAFVSDACRMHHAVLSVTEMRILLLVASAICLSGCINVYGPVKPSGEQQSAAAQGTDPEAPTAAVRIGNRKPDELWDAVQLYYRQKGININVADSATGIIAGTGDDPALVSRYLDCSLLPQTQNSQETYRIVTQVWSAGEGTNVSASVTGVAGVTAADGNDKVKPVACTSQGVFERDLLERLRK